MATDKTKHKRGPVLCVSTGQIYETAAQAAAANNATAGAMSNHLAGRKPTLGGKVYQRIEEKAATDE